MAYEHDRYGRRLRDGELSLSYDENGNTLTLEYPGEVTAVYDHDFTDRPVSLTVQRPSEVDQSVVTAAIYLPSGPLTGLTLGNGLSETRAFNGRYVPDRITLAGAGTLLDWDDTTDLTTSAMRRPLHAGAALQRGEHETYAICKADLLLNHRPCNSSSTSPVWGSTLNSRPSQL